MTEEKPANMTAEMYEIHKLRRDILEFEERIGDKMHEFNTKMLSLQNSLNQRGATIKGYTIKELMALKQLGVSPKDILSGVISESDGSKAKKENASIDSNMSQVQGDRSYPPRAYNRNKEIKAVIEKHGYSENNQKSGEIGSS